jgi:hypothetical protein
MKLRKTYTRTQIISFIYFDSFLFQRQRIQRNSDSESDDDPEQIEEQPQVVVLKSGDLTSDQAKIEKLRLEKGE